MPLFVKSMKRSSGDGALSSMKFTFCGFLIDEAHNLPDIARNVFSMQITWNSIGLCEKEAVEYGDPEILSGIRISDFMEIIRTYMAL